MFLVSCELVNASKAVTLVPTAPPPPKDASTESNLLSTDVLNAVTFPIPVITDALNVPCAVISVAWKVL